MVGIFYGQTIIDNQSIKLSEFVCGYLFAQQLVNYAPRTLLELGYSNYLKCVSILTFFKSPSDIYITVV